ILRRHDQRPHQRAISRPSVTRAVLGARRGARRVDLSASGRSGDAGAGARRAQGIAPRDLGMDIRDRLARIAPHLRLAVRPLSPRPNPLWTSWPNTGIPAVAAPQPPPAPRLLHPSSP